MSGFLATLQFWHWWILAAALAPIQAVAPGWSLTWLGSRAAIGGLAALVLRGLGWAVGSILFAVVAVVAVFVGRHFLHRRMASHDPALTRRGERYLGRQFTLGTAIVNGR